MPGNSFGQCFKITTFGESHGGGVGVIIDGVTPNIELSIEDIQIELDRRKPGQSDITTPRDESDSVHFMSGVFEGYTTGTPLMMMIYNKDARSNAYDNIRDLFRPGHADFSYHHKYAIRDHRGSGRASGRETAARVAAGALAKKILKETHGIEIVAYVKAAAGIECETIDYSQIEKNIVRACDARAAQKIIEQVLAAKDRHDSMGGIVECTINNVPAGIGSPAFDKLDADLAKAIMSLGAVKGFEVGSGFKCAEMTGIEHNDCMDKNGFKSNNAGGILGGISTGAPIVFRCAVKPTSSLQSPQNTVDINNNEVICETFGRHDPIICPRIVPVVEAMAAIVILDHIKRQAALLAK
ncbi:MAG: chorismate synthase [Lentisphaeria bacterium]